MGKEGENRWERLDEAFRRAETEGEEKEPDDRIKEAIRYIEETTEAGSQEFRAKIEQLKGIKRRLEAGEITL